MGNAVGRVAESVAAGVLLYSVLWILQNRSGGTDLVNGVVALVGALGVRKASATWVRAGVLLLLGIAVRIVAFWTPVPQGVDTDPFFARSILRALASALCGAAAVCGLLAGAMSVSMSGRWWGLPLVAVALVVGYREISNVSRRVSRVWSPAVF
jgi:uncharacterized membrane protein HdeD (DUF308 family)